MNTTFQNIAVILFILSSLDTCWAQLPLQWHLGNEATLNFENEPPKIEFTGIPSSSESTHSYTPPMQYSDESDSLATLISDSLRYDLMGDSMVKSRMKQGINYSGKANLAILDSFVLQRVNSVDKRLYIFWLYNIINGETIVLKTIDASKYWHSSTDGLNGQIIKNEGGYTVLLSYVIGEGFTSVGKAFLAQYNLKGNNLVKLAEYHVPEIFDLTYDDRYEWVDFLTSSSNAQVFFNFFTSHQKEPITSPAIAFMGSFQISADSLYNFKMIKKYWVAKMDFNEEGYFNSWDYPMYIREGMIFSPNDSFVYSYYLGQKFVEGNFSNRYRYNYQVIIERYKPGNMEDRDTFVVQGDYTHHFIKGDFTIGSNGNIYFISRAQDSAFYCVTSIEKPNRNLPLSQQIHVNSFQISPYIDWYSPVYRLPLFNKAYKKLEFRKGAQCSPNLRLFAAADAYYDSFEWYIANDTGGFDVRYGKNLAYEAPGKNQFYVKLKGIAQNGHYAWYSDTVSFTTGPKASFTANTSLWCQYVALQMKNTSQGQFPENEYSVWKIYHNNSLEKTYKAKNPKITFDKTGNYDIELIYNNGFYKDSVRKTAVISIIEAPKPGFSLTDSLLCTPDTIVVHDEAQGRITDRYYVFNEKDTIWKAEFSKEINVTGKYSILQVLKGLTNCIATAQKNIRVITGFTQNDRAIALTTQVIDEQSLEFNWKAYPGIAHYDLYKNGLKINTHSDTFYNDFQVQTANESYSYQVKVIDSCGHSGDFSNPVNSLLLKAENHDNEYLSLTWTAFKKWENGVAHYDLEYAFAPGHWNLLEQSQDLFTTDPVSEEKVNKTIYYRIVANEKNGNHQIATSNVVSEELLPTLFIPNAFSPNDDGINDIFQAKGFGIDQIVFHVFSRTGQSLHISYSLDNLWDGTINRLKMPAGAYVYLLEGKTTNGAIIKKNGVFYLLE